MGADMDTGIALYAFFRMITDLSIFHGQCARRATVRADAAVLAEPSRLRIVTVSAVNVASLQKHCRPVARTVHTAEWNDPVYNRLHQSSR